MYSIDTSFQNIDVLMLEILIVFTSTRNAEESSSNSFGYMGYDRQVNEDSYKSIACIIEKKVTLMLNVG